MLPYRYTYLVGTLYFLAIWLLFFWKWPKRRWPMIFVGFLYLGLGIFAEYFWWTKDWWHPQTITGTKIGPEDFILSFTVSGISILVYKFFFKKDLDRGFEMNGKTLLAATQKLAPLFFASFGVSSLLFFTFHIRSVISTSVGMIVSIVFVLARRKDLLPAMFWSAILLTAISIPAYFVFIFLSPGSVEAFWNFSQISGLKIIGIPIEDVIWFALAGFMMGGIVEYGFGYKLINEKE